MPRGDGVTQRWYLALSGSSSVRCRPVFCRHKQREAALRLLGLPLYMRAFTALATCEGRGGVAGRPRGSLRGSSSRTRGSLRGSPPCTNFGPRRPRASTTRPPTALGPEAKPTSASTSAWRAPRSAARARTRAGASRPARTARDGDHPGAARAGGIGAQRKTRFVSQADAAGVQKKELELHQRRDRQWVDTFCHTFKQASVSRASAAAAAKPGPPLS